MYIIWWCSEPSSIIFQYLLETNYLYFHLLCPVVVTLEVDFVIKGGVSFFQTTNFRDEKSFPFGQCTEWMGPDKHIFKCASFRVTVCPLFTQSLCRLCVAGWAPWGSPASHGALWKSFGAWPPNNTYTQIEANLWYKSYFTNHHRYSYNWNKLHSNQFKILIEYLALKLGTHKVVDWKWVDFA